MLWKEVKKNKNYAFVSFPFTLLHSSILTAYNGKIRPVPNGNKHSTSLTSPLYSIDTHFDISTTDSF